MSVQTVLGAVEARSLGATLTHEHLVMDFSHFYRPPPAHAAAALGADAVRLETAGALRQYPYSSRYNLRLCDAAAREAVLTDLRAFRAAGGGALVENTTCGLGRDLEFMRRAARDTGLHIVAGTGYYIADLQSASVRAASTESMYEAMRKELVEGCAELPGVRAGFMGEIASVWPIHEMEKRCIRAAGEVQAETGHGVSFHPHRDPRAPAEIMRLYLEAGGRAHKAVMSHLDRTLHSVEELLEFSSLGSYLQFDLFGTECSLYQLAPECDMPSDAQRIARLHQLTQHGLGDRLLLSHDIHTKHRLTSFGGHGYAHVLVDIVPRMLQRGFTAHDTQLMTQHNPAAWLSLSL